MRAGRDCKRARSRPAAVRCRGYAYRTDYAFTCAMDCLSRLPPGLEITAGPRAFSRDRASHSASHDTVARLRAHGAELLGEIAQYESLFLLCYLRGPRASSSPGPNRSADAGLPQDSGRTLTRARTKPRR